MYASGFAVGRGVAEVVRHVARVEEARSRGVVPMKIAPTFHG
jgi:hypothetical protein